MRRFRGHGDDEPGKGGMTKLLTQRDRSDGARTHLFVKRERLGRILDSKHGLLPGKIERVPLVALGSLRRSSGHGTRGAR